MTQFKDGDRQPRNLEERSLSASPVVARQQGNGWDEPCKLRGLRTVLWAAGGENSSGIRPTRQPTTPTRKERIFAYTRRFRADVFRMDGGQKYRFAIYLGDVGGSLLSSVYKGFY